MFTGLVEARGRLVITPAPHTASDGARIVVGDVPFAAELAIGESVAVDGVCLTVVAHDDRSFTADVMAETLRRTTLGRLAPDHVVNLERAARSDGRLGGHVVQGHVDATARLIAVRTEGDARILRLQVADAQAAALIAAKGSIAVDGVSLTVSARRADWFEVSLIPQTQRDTDLGALAVGDEVNLETDVLARQLRRLLVAGVGAADATRAAPTASLAAAGTGLPTAAPAPIDAGVVTTDAIPADPRDAEDDRAVARAVDALRQGLPVLVADDERRENEGDAIISAALATPHWIAWMIRHTSGYLCAPMPDAIADRLALPPMVADNRDPKGTAYTVTCDAATGVTTGISAADRCHTLNVLADSATAPDGLTRPGHVVPLRARPGGVLERAGHTEASVDLMRIAGLPEVAAIGEMVLDSGEMMRFPDLVRMGDAAGLPVLTVAQIARWRERRERPADADAVVAPVPAATGDWQEVRA